MELFQGVYLNSAMIRITESNSPYQIRARRRSTTAFENSLCAVTGLIRETPPAGLQSPTNPRRVDIGAAGERKRERAATPYAVPRDRGVPSTISRVCPGDSVVLCSLPRPTIRGSFPRGYPAPEGNKTTPPPPSTRFRPPRGNRLESLV